jgi:hypothetical protein
MQRACQREWKKYRRFHQSVPCCPVAACLAG